LLLAGKWPEQVQRRSGPGSIARVSGRIWWQKFLEGYSNMWFIGGKTRSPNRKNEVPVIIHTRATPVNHVDGWSWSRVVTEIRQWADIYPDPLPEPERYL